MVKCVDELFVLIIFSVLFRQAYTNCSEKNNIYKKINPELLPTESTNHLATKTTRNMALCSVECTHFDGCVSFVYNTLAATKNCLLNSRIFKPLNITGVEIYSKDYSTDFIQINENCSSGGKCYELSCVNAPCNCPPAVDGSCDNKNGDICQCLFAQGKTHSGIYNMKSAAGDMVKIYCDQTTDDGGWLVIQRNNCTGPWFKKTWQEYKDGFGELEESFWWGNEIMHQITSRGNYELRIDVKLTDGSNGFGKYTGFEIANEFYKYKLILKSGSYKGNIADSLFHPWHLLHQAVGKKFSTFDQDNDLCPTCACATDSNGWWFGQCTVSALNKVSPVWKNLDNRIANTEMKIRRVV